LQCFISLYANNFEKLPHLVWECNDVLAWQKELEGEQGRGTFECVTLWLWLYPMMNVHLVCPRPPF